LQYINDKIEPQLYGIEDPEINRFPSSTVVILHPIAFPKYKINFTHVATSQLSATFRENQLSCSQISMDVSLDPFSPPNKCIKDSFKTFGVGARISKFLTVAVY
jgi:hypothetical protein